MSGMEEFKSVLEEIYKKKQELMKYQDDIDAIYKKMNPLHEELEMLYEKKRLAETAFLMEVEKEVKK